MLNRIRNLISFYFSLAWKSVSDTGVYLRTALLPMRLLITYTLVASLFLASGHAVRFWYQEAPVLQNKIEQTWQELSQAWPETLVAEYSNGTWSITPSEPIQVTYPSVWEKPENWPETLLTVLPVEPDTISAELPSLFVSGPTKLMVRSPGQSETQLVNWSELLPDQKFTVSKQRVVEATPNVPVLARFALQQLALTVFLWRFLGVWLLRILGLLFYTWLAQMLWTLRGRKLAYWSVYKMGLLIVPVAEFLMLLWSTLWPQLPLPLSFWWVWLIILGAIILTAPRKSASQQPVV